MIKKLKLKFIVLSMTSLFMLLMIMVAGMNIINYTSVCREADEILSLISQNRGVFPDFKGKGNNKLPHNLSPELPYESRYFSVLLDQSGNLIYVETSRITSVDTTMAIAYAQDVTNDNKTHGFINDYRFLQSIEEDTTRITFLDYGRKLDSFYRFLFISMGMALIGFLIVFFIISFSAGKIIKPIAESYEKQKRFITDAGHEIKTPLTIINANVDILKMDIGENECLEDIEQQTKRLTSLVNNLVYLARMEEAGNPLPMIEFPVSEIVQETAMSFKNRALVEKKTFQCNVQPMLSMRGNNKAIEELVSILMDNALKYSPSGGSISLDLTGQNRTLSLTVLNTTQTVINPNDLSYVFDRFYRTDKSRNSETGGYGIGLSVAKAIVTSHGGKIHADTHDGHSFRITVTLPI